jgi:predicted SprT family Zn-dependent metalloprotease
VQSGTPDPDSPRDLCSYARLYAESVDIDVDHDAIEWEVSKRARRRAGACTYDADADTVTIRLTWDAYREHGWRQFTATIRHELVHAWEFQKFGSAGHGPRFREKAAAVDAPRHCEAFADARLELSCASACGWTADRHRASSPVQDPGRYRCPDCGSDLVVEHVDSGVRWRDAAGYTAARDEITDW